MPRYRAFAQVEYEFVRRVYPAFEWTVFEEASPRHPLALPLARARVTLVGTAGAYVRGQRPCSLGNEGDPTYREIPAEILAAVYAVQLGMTLDQITETWAPSPAPSATTVAPTSRRVARSTTSLTRPRVSRSTIARGTCSSASVRHEQSYLTMGEGFKLAAQIFDRDVAHLSCCA